MSSSSGVARRSTWTLRAATATLAPACLALRSRGGRSATAVLAVLASCQATVCEMSVRVDCAPMTALTCCPGGMTSVPVCAKPIAAVEPKDGGASAAPVPQLVFGVPPIVNSSVPPEVTKDA